MKDAGYSPDDIGVLLPDRTDSQALADEAGVNAAGGAAAGALTGGILGGLAGWLIGIGSLAIPGIGPFIGAGVLATALGGAALGAGVGGLAGALIGMGVPEEEASWYEQEVRGGRSLVTVRAGTRYQQARDLLRGYGAYDVESRGATAVGGGMTSSATTGDVEATSAPTATGRSSAGVGPVPSAATGGPTAVRTSTWEAEASRYRSAWQSRYGSSGGRWEEYEPRYRYGWELAGRPEYRGRSWAEIESEARRGWEGRYPGSTWDEVKETVRETWES